MWWSFFNLKYWVVETALIRYDFEAATGGVLYKKLLLNCFNIHRKTPVVESLFNKVGGLWARNFIKRESNTGVFLWILPTFKNTFFEERFRWLYLMIVHFSIKLESIAESLNQNQISLGLQQEKNWLNESKAYSISVFTECL